MPPFFATSHFIGDSRHPLYRFSDAAMHWACYERWTHRKEFAALYFESKIANAEMDWLRRSWRVLLRTNSMLVTYGLVVNEVSVVFRDSGTSVRVARADWQDWLAGTWRNGCRGSLECEVIECHLNELAKVDLP